MLRMALLAGILCLTSAPAIAESAPAPNAQILSTAVTTIGDLLDNPAAKAVLDKHMPGFSGNPQIEMARSMTMKQVQAFAPDSFTDEVLAKIDADLAAIAGK